jgi:hypothetical protein
MLALIFFILAILVFGLGAVLKWSAIAIVIAAILAICGVGSLFRSSR